MALYAVPTEPAESIAGVDVLAEIVALLEARLPGVAVDDPAYDHLGRLHGPLRSLVGLLEAH